MNIEVRTPTLKDLFAHASVFHVPVYQRDYSWNESNWSQLWEDVTTSQGEHFIGSIVTITKPKKNLHAASLNTNEIVDGQQRIATLIILFAAIRDSLVRPEKKIAEYIHENVIESRAIGGSQDKLKLGERDQPQFKKVTSKGTKNFTKEDIKSGVVECYNYFLSKISEWQKQHNGRTLSSLASNIEASIVLVWISTTKEEDAFRLFETLNDRGLDLSAADLIKNMLLSEASKGKKKPRASDLPIIIENWNQMMTLLEKERVRFFRQYHLATRPGRGVHDKNVYAAFKKILTTKKDPQHNPRKLSDDLLEASRNYHTIIFADSENDLLNDRLTNLRDLGAISSYPLVLSVMIRKMSEVELVKLIDAVQVFSLRRMICKRPSNKADLLYNQWGNDKDTRTVTQLIKMMRPETPDDPEFEENLRKYPFDSNRLASYILRELHLRIIGRNASPELQFKDQKTVHVEHIMPKNPVVSKGPSKGYDWRNDVGKGSRWKASEMQENYETYLYGLGNLTLVTGKKNVAMSNLPLTEKVKTYKQSAFPPTKKLGSKTEWTFDSIMSRTETLAKECVKHWSFDAL